MVVGGGGGHQLLASFFPCNAQGYVKISHSRKHGAPVPTPLRSAANAAYQVPYSFLGIYFMIIAKVKKKHERIGY